MFTRKSNRGQALIIIVFAIIGLIALVALAIDGGNVFAARRKAQSAADNAALAAALAKVNSQSITVAAYGITRAPAYNFADSTVTIQNPPGPGCSGVTPNPVNSSDPTDSAAYYIQVMIRSSVNTYFAPIVGINNLSYCVYAISHGISGTTGVPFYGNSIVGLDPTPGHTGFNSGNSESAHWVFNRGGIFSNSDAYSKNSGSVTFQNGACVTTVGTESGFSGCAMAQNQTSLKYNYPADIIPLLPPIPPCTGTAYYSGGKVHEQVGFEGMGSKLTGQDLLTGSHPAYAPGVYCITDAGGNLTNDIITGTGVTFYIKSAIYQLSLSGHGYIGASAPTTGTYKGLLMFSGITPTPCTQNIDILGNGGTPIVGSIFLPSACIYYGGNGVGDLTDSMMVGYQVSSNGTGDLYISYNSDHNYQPSLSPTVELTK